MFRNSLNISLKNINIYVNEEKSRTFIALAIEDSFQQEMLSLLDSVDTVVEKFNLQSFYEDPSFHTSILWCNGDKKDYINQKLESNHYQKSINDLLLKYDKQLNIRVNHIICKTGNKMFKYDLK